MTYQVNNDCGIPMTFTISDDPEDTDGTAIPCDAPLVDPLAEGEYSLAIGGSATCTLDTDKTAKFPGNYENRPTLVFAAADHEFPTASCSGTSG